VTRVSRRALLAGGAILLAGFPAAAGPAAAAPMTPLSEAERRALTLVARTLFPHPLLADTPYRQIIDASFSATADPTPARAALGRLDAEGVAFARRSEAGRAEALASQMGDPFFQGLRIGVLIGLYANLEVTRGFGYQGPSFEAGGYIDRGFDALPWLPSPLGMEASQWPI
jgi:hypothetical protein